MWKTRESYLINEKISNQSTVLYIIKLQRTYIVQRKLTKCNWRIKLENYCTALFPCVKTLSSFRVAGQSIRKLSCSCRVSLQVRSSHWFFWWVSFAIICAALWNEASCNAIQHTTIIIVGSKTLKSNQFAPREVRTKLNLAFWVSSWVYFQTNF